MSLEELGKGRRTHKTRLRAGDSTEWALLFYILFFRRNDTAAPPLTRPGKVPR